MDPTFFRTRRLSMCGALSWLLLPGLAHAETNDDLVAQVRAGHRIARESMRTFSATITLETTLPKKAVVRSGKYWRSTDTVRVHENTGTGSSEDYLLKNSEIRQVGMGRDAKTNNVMYSASRRPVTETLCICDPWKEMFLNFAGPQGEPCDFDHFLKFAKKSPKAKREKLAGHECVRLSLTLDGPPGAESHVILWHDIKHNYLLRKLEFTSSNSDRRSEVEIVEFTEPVPGVFVPTKNERRTFDNAGKQLSGSVAFLSDLVVNKPIAKTVFTLPAIPPGTELYDWIQGAKYPIDANWRAIGPAKPLMRVFFPGNSGS